MTDGRTDGQTDGGDCNIPYAFLKKRGDKYNYSTQHRLSGVLSGQAQTSMPSLATEALTLIFIFLMINA